MSYIFDLDENIRNDGCLNFDLSGVARNDGYINYANSYIKQYMNEDEDVIKRTAVLDFKPFSSNELDESDTILHTFNGVATFKLKDLIGDMEKEVMDALDEEEEEDDPNEWKITIYDSDCEECVCKYNKNRDKLIECEAEESDDAPYIDFLEGMIFQSDTYEEFCKAYATHYFTHLPMDKRSKLSFEDFGDLFCKTMIMNDERYTGIMRETANRIIDILLLNYRVYVV